MKQKGYYFIIELILGSIFSLAFLALTVYLVYTFTISAFIYGKEIGASATEEKPSKEVTIVLQDNSTIDDVAKILYNEGIIDNEFIYKLESILKGSNDNFIGGEFVVNMNMDSNQLNAALRKSAFQSTDIKITISEGFSVADIAEYLESKQIVTAEEFITACNNNEFKYEFLKDVPQRDNRLEGYLFPDTYFIAEGSSPVVIINKLLSRFDEIYNEEIQAKATAKGLTKDEVITMASIIEKEIKIPAERGKASAVIYNRLEQGMNLQMCSTISYVLDKNKNRLSEEDLKIESPYNTYIHEGLPVGPISNPGQACIEAALEPEESDYLYFVVKDEKTGEHVFTNDYDVFTEAKVLYKQAN